VTQGKGKLKRGKRKGEDYSGVTSGREVNSFTLEGGSEQMQSMDQTNDGVEWI